MMVSADRTQHAQAKRERIHQAAQTLFMQHSFEATSMDAIAVAAEVSKPTLYRYYQNKEALFVAILEQLALHHLSQSALLALRDTPMDSLATLEHPQTPPPERVAALIRLVLQGIASHSQQERN